MVQRAVLLVNGSASDDEEASDLAWRITESYGDGAVEAIAYYVVDELPDWVNIALADQLTAHKRDADGETYYMLLYMGTEEEILEHVEDTSDIEEADE